MNRRRIALVLVVGVLAVSAVTTTVRMVQEAKSETETVSAAAVPDDQYDNARPNRHQARREARHQAMQALMEEGVVTEDTPRDEARRLLRERIERDREAGLAY